MEHAPRGANKIAEALANLTATLTLGAKENTKVLICEQWVVKPPNADGEEMVKVVSACAVDKEDWGNRLLTTRSTESCQVM